MNTGWMGNEWAQQQRQQPFMGYQMPMMAPKYEVIRVSGEESAKNFRMAPNSSALLLDESAPIVWYAQTDGTGYLTVTPFDVTPHQVQAPTDINDLSARVAKLEEYFANVQQSNTPVTKSTKKQRQNANANTNTGAANNTAATTISDQITDATN